MPPRRDAAERFWEKVNKTDGCWLWTACLNHAGYGSFWDRSMGGHMLAHRWSYLKMVGPIPEGLELDHLCRVPRCVNPRHLEAVTRRVNTLRGLAPAARQARQTHCHAGHPLSGDNLYLYPSGRRRACRTCRAQYRSSVVDAALHVFDGDDDDDRV